MSTIYRAITPYGAFQAEWSDDEDSRVEYTGSADAIAYFKAFLGLNSISGVGGALIEFDYLQPADFYGFCQSAEYGITVLPTEDDLMDELESKEMSTTPVLDAVSAAESFQLIGESAQIFTRLDENAPTFFPDLDRLRYIMTELGGDAPAVVDPHAEARAYLQTVIDGTADLTEQDAADELGKIGAAVASDADMLALFKSAVTAYAAYAIAQADAALKENT